MYGFFWICVELVAQQGKNCRIDAKRDWKKVLSYISRKNENQVEQFTRAIAEYDLIDKNALNKGNLYIPKLREYSDNYTDKVRTKFDKVRTLSVQGTDSVRVEEKRREEKRSVYARARARAYTHTQKKKYTPNIRGVINVDDLKK